MVPGARNCPMQSIRNFRLPLRPFFSQPYSSPRSGFFNGRMRILAVPSDPFQCPTIPWRCERTRLRPRPIWKRLIIPSQVGFVATIADKWDTSVTIAGNRRCARRATCVGTRAMYPEIGRSCWFASCSVSSPQRVKVLVCFACKKTGHMSFECPDKTRQPSSTTGDAGEPTEK